MSAKRKTVHRARQLILGYLESVSREVFSDFPRVLTDLVGREHGVYALYKKGHLYYIGLATNLRTRIKNHLRDKHAGKWDSFSLYLVRKADHIRELESLILRIADPKGNRTRGKLPRASNLRRDLWKGIKIEQETKLIEMFGSGIKPRKVGKKPERPRKTRPTSTLPLTEYVKRPFKVRAKYKGKYFMALVRQDGRIRYNGVLYSSPSGAGKAVVGRALDGWYFWRYRNHVGEWVELNALRKKRP